MKIKPVETPLSVQQIALPTKAKVGRTTTTTSTFADVLRGKLPSATAAVKFSAHAADRLASRNIVLTAADISKLDNAVQTMEQKGSREALVVMDNLAMIVNITNKTVVTAVEKSPQEVGKVFTNIDSALIM